MNSAVKHTRTFDNQVLSKISSRKSSVQNEESQAPSQDSRLPLKKLKKKLETSNMRASNSLKAYDQQNGIYQLNAFSNRPQDERKIPSMRNSKSNSNIQSVSNTQRSIKVRKREATYIAEFKDLKYQKQQLEHRSVLLNQKF